MSVKDNKEFAAKMAMDNILQADSAQFETCVLCGKLTDVPLAQEVEYRAFYVEGAGQLCYDCYHKIYR